MNLLLSILLLPFSLLNNPGFFSGSEMKEFQSLYSKNPHILKWERHRDWDLQANVIEYEFERIQVFLNPKEPQTIDSCTYALYSVYEKSEEYADGGVSYQSNKLTLEYASFIPATSHLYFEKLDKQPKTLNKWVIEANSAPSRNIHDLRAQCKKGTAANGYTLTKAFKVSPKWEPHH